MIDIDHCILTHSGKYFDLLRPEVSAYTVNDIATALSRICRFVGHTRHFYSVAQHSVEVSYLLPDSLAFAGLMHDASEAYLGDVSYPLKCLLPQYREIERSVEQAIARVFSLPYPHPAAVKVADRIMMATERRDLMIEQEADWPILADVAPRAQEVVPVGVEVARLMFLERFSECQRMAAKISAAKGGGA